MKLSKSTICIYPLWGFKKYVFKAWNPTWIKCLPPLPGHQTCTVSHNCLNYSVLTHHLHTLTEHTSHINIS